MYLGKDIAVIDLGGPDRGGCAAPRSHRWAIAASLCGLASAALA
jgi:hypothetical protein